MFLFSSDFAHAEEPVATPVAVDVEHQIEEDLAFLLRREITRLSRECKVASGLDGVLRLELIRENIVVRPESTLPGAAGYFVTSDGPLRFNLSDPELAACLEKAGKKTGPEEWYPSQFSSRPEGYVCSLDVSKQDDFGVPLVACIVVDELKPVTSPASERDRKR
mgnify:CR=1 FL=1